MTTHVRRSEQEPASSNHQLACVKFIPPTAIIPGLVADALDKECSVEELIKLQGKKWFAYPLAQQCFMDELWSKEREEFHQLLNTRECSDRLRGCMYHRGELFDEYAQPGDSEALASDVVLNQRIAWADLMTEELEYLGRQAQWHDYHRTMAIHACGVMSKLLEAWTVPDNGTVPPHVLPRLLNATRAILQGASFKQLVSADFSLEEAAVLSEVIILAGALDDIELAEEVTELLPIVFELCQTHFPEKFCSDQLDGASFYQEYDDDEFHDDEFDDDEFGDDRFDEDIDGSDQQGGMLSEESLDDADDLLVSKGYKHLEGEDVADDASFSYGQFSEEEKDSLWAVLVTSLGICLRELQRVPAREYRIEHLQNILASSPMDMVMWQEVVDALISVSPKDFNDSLPSLLNRCLDDLSGGLCILGIADYSFRKELVPSDGPLLALAKELKAMKPRDRQALLASASEFLNEGPDLFLDFEAAEAGFAMLCKWLGMRGLMRGR